MRKFLTEYNQGGDAYALHIYATSLDEANRIAESRNIGEVIAGESLDWTHFSQVPKSTMEALHEACFLSYLAVKSGKMGLDDVLGDKGVLHEMAHLLHLSNKKVDAQEFCGQLAHLRSIIPGYEPV